MGVSAPLKWVVMSRTADCDDTDSRERARCPPTRAWRPRVARAHVLSSCARARPSAHLSSRPFSRARARAYSGASSRVSRNGASARIALRARARATGARVARASRLVGLVARACPRVRALASRVAGARANALASRVVGARAGALLERRGCSRARARAGRPASSRLRARVTGALARVLVCAPRASSRARARRCPSPLNLHLVRRVPARVHARPGASYPRWHAPRRPWRASCRVVARARVVSSRARAPAGLSVQPVAFARILLRASSRARARVLARPYPVGHHSALPALACSPGFANMLPTRGHQNAYGSQTTRES